jgi:hypothetical protein
MSEPVSFLAIPKRRDYLTFGIGKRLRDRFSRNQSTPLPPVKFYTPGEARKLGLPATGWYHYGERNIGMVIDPSRPPSREWVWATLLSVHEHLHWLFNFTPAAFGLALRHERWMWNVMLDASNEQRAFLEDPWAGKILRRGRQMIFDEHAGGNLIAVVAETPGISDQDTKRRVIMPSGNIPPVYLAGNLVLAAHTLLMAKGTRMLRRLYAERAEPGDIWELLQSQLGAPPAPIQHDWPEAFRLASSIWKQRNEFDRADLLREFLGLFPLPQPADQPPPSPFEIGGHRGDKSPAGTEPPPGSNPLGQQRQSSRRSPASNDQSSEEGGGDGDQSNDKGQPSSDEGQSPDDSSGSGQDHSSSGDGATHENDGESPDGSSPSGPGDHQPGPEGYPGQGTINSSPASSGEPPSPIPPGENPDGSSDPSNSPEQGGKTNEDSGHEPLRFDPEPNDDQGGSPSGSSPDPYDDPTQVEGEAEDLNKDAESWIPGGSFVAGPDRVIPADASGLIIEALGPASELRQRLKVGDQPLIRRRSDTGRPIPRIIAREPDAPRPFRTTSVRQITLGPTVFGAVFLDSSGSMRKRKKWHDSQVAAMAAHLAFQAASVSHVVLMSRTLAQLAGDGISPERAASLIAGARPHATSGDNYTTTLPLAYNRIREQPQDVRVAIIITDGVPNSPKVVAETVRDMRAAGVTTVGIGLDLVEAEVLGLKGIFGQDCVAISHDGGHGQSFAVQLALVINAAIRRGKTLFRMLSTRTS